MRSKEKKGGERGKKGGGRKCGAYAAPHPAAGLSPARFASYRMLLLLLTASGYAAVNYGLRPVDFPALRARAHLRGSGVPVVCRQSYASSRRLAHSA